MAIGLEVDGAPMPFPANDRVTMKVRLTLSVLVNPRKFVVHYPQVFDERDTEVGSRMILERTSMKPYKDGLHYFASLEWNLVGSYRMTFKHQSFSRGASVVTTSAPTPLLSFFVTVSDPEW